MKSFISSIVPEIEDCSELSVSEGSAASGAFVSAVSIMTEVSVGTLSGAGVRVPQADAESIAAVKRAAENICFFLMVKSPLRLWIRCFQKYRYFTGTKSLRRRLKTVYLQIEKCLIF